ncbi:peptidoglycan DD-metalloendopeptidase family protein [Williamsia deligens]|uniref:Peptidoglycan DD-metalloendopeptidase family protein n=1 Tax=Williamsia deligens TaxID=321325 RepID=A0ABW3GH80_9NOCA|nr:peptidoglycan DD-metalloendopeptidase family protein [Williamsia deligens]
MRVETTRGAALRRPVAQVLCVVALVSGGAGSPADAAIPGGYGWPMDPRPSVVRVFDPPAQRWLAGHRGVDVVGSPIVVSAGAGTVHFAGSVGGKQVVSVLHADGILTTYEPVEPSVRVGDVVARGDPLGTLMPGHPACASTCLHWGARRGTGSSAVYLDPRALVGAVRVRLLPLRDR